MVKVVGLGWCKGRQERRRWRRRRRRRRRRRWIRKSGNRSPKGNMWSAILVALPCLIVNWSERKQGSGPEGDEVL